ncbi:MAG TPA: FdhF/YdeP family oxidoreductase, partial [Candidatus Binataceae bacterium]|nr:FdhF/YdeP family oxidoreductase [Candidatus Binataceae bacterium]
FGQNVGSNSPRMLHSLQSARQRDVPIVTFNPLRERGLERFVNPQSPTEMLTSASTQISTQYHQVTAGGDIAAIAGICKSLFEMDEQAKRGGRKPIIDYTFAEQHAHGLEQFADLVNGYSWERLEQSSGLTRNAMQEAAAAYAQADRVIAVYGMGLTQHRAGVETVQMLINLLLLRGNIGKRGAGICPVRGHSNVQGQRTVGISEKPELVPLDRLAQQYEFSPPRNKGLNTIETCEAIVAGKVRAFIGLGGNFVRAVPDRDLIEPAWRRLRLTVQIATKLNRSQLIHGEIAYILPCLGRTDIDQQPGGPQAVSVEDSTACIHGSRGFHSPPSKDLRSEVSIVAGLAKALLKPNPRIDWDGWVADHSRIRDAIEQTYPEDFKQFNQRMWQPGGFHRPIAARERKWKTANGKANFIIPRSLDEDPDMPANDRGVLKMITLRSNDQFNTTIYGYNDRFRGVRGTRTVALMNANDIERLRLRDGDLITLVTVANDEMKRELNGLRVTTYNIPEGCLGTYYPEANVLIPLWHHADRAKVPAAKSVPVRVVRQ